MSIDYSPPEPEVYTGPVFDLNAGAKPSDIPAGRLVPIDGIVTNQGIVDIYQVIQEDGSPVARVIGQPRPSEGDRGFLGGLLSSVSDVLKQVPILPMGINMVAPGVGSALTAANAIATNNPLALLTALPGLANLGGAADAATAASDLAKIEASMGPPSLTQGIESALPATTGPQPVTATPPATDSGIAAADVAKIGSSMGPVEGIKTIPTDTYGPPVPPDEYFTSGIKSTEIARPTITEVTGPTLPEAGSATKAALYGDAGYGDITGGDPTRAALYGSAGYGDIAAGDPTKAALYGDTGYGTAPTGDPTRAALYGDAGYDAITGDPTKAALYGDAGYGAGAAAAAGDPTRAALYGNEGYGPMSDQTVTQAPIDTSKVSSLGPAATVSDIADKGLGSLLDKLQTPEGMLTLATLFGSGALSNLFGSGGGGGGITGGGSNISIPTKTATQTLLPMPEYVPYTGEAVMGREYFSPVTYAAEGGMMKGRYLRGESDGMADEIKTSIEGEQPARLSHGEFVIPADVVSHLGNGNSDAGAKVLYKMMDKVRVARTGSKEQGKQIKPEKFTPGGEAKFQSGGATRETANPFAASPYGSTAQTQLSDWAAPYVTGILSEARALGQLPYKAYTGPLSAGWSPLQKQAFTEAGGLGEPAEYNVASGIAQGLAGAQQGYNPMLFMPTFQAPTEYRPTGESFIGQAERYMSPYTSAVLAPQLQALRRQADIQKTMLGPQMVKGGFGSRSQLAQRQADAEAMRQQQQAIGSALGQAYQQGMGQFNTEQARRAQEAQFGAQQAMQAAQLGAQYGQSAQEATERSRQFAAQQGLSALGQRLQAAQALGNLGTARANVQQQNLAQRLAAGAAQRAMEQEGIAAMKAQFEEQRKWPYSQIQFQQGLLQGLPIQTTSYTPNLTDLQRFAQTGKEVGTVYQMFKDIFGIK